MFVDEIDLSALANMAGYCHLAIIAVSRSGDADGRRQLDVFAPDQIVAWALSSRSINWVGE
jgi:hypothetical protein